MLPLTVVVIVAIMFAIDIGSKLSESRISMTWPMWLLASIVLSIWNSTKFSLEFRKTIKSPLEYMVVSTGGDRGLTETWAVTWAPTNPFSLKAATNCAGLNVG